jgi:thioredoxin 1
MEATLHKRSIWTVPIITLFCSLVILPTHAQDSVKAPTPQITFIELGSDKCVPCRMMQPILKSVQQKYGNQIRVVFYDVWKAEQKKFGKEYGVRVIPTQVFLDKTGKEVYRHEGFFPESAIDTLLGKHSLKVLSQR